MDENAARVPMIERRRKPRIDCQYLAIVQGRDGKGKIYKDSARLVNLSATGLYMWVNHPIKPGEKVFVIVRINSGMLKETTPKIATDAIVTRTELQPDGLLGVAIEFERYRFL
jgi:hypothetical protein